MSASSRAAVKITIEITWHSAAADKKKVAHHSRNNGIGSVAGNMFPMLFLLNFDVDDPCRRPIYPVVACSGYFPRLAQLLVVVCLVSKAVDELVSQIIITSAAVHRHVDGGS